MTDKRTLCKEDSLLHLWSYGINARMEHLAREKRHLRKEMERYEDARSAKFRTWLAANNYAWCGVCDSVIMLWMRHWVYVETYALTDEYHRADLLHGKLLTVCTSCHPSCQKTNVRDYEQRMPVEREYHNVIYHGPGSYLVGRKSTTIPDYTEWVRLPCSTVCDDVPKRVSEKCTAIAGLPVGTPLAAAYAFDVYT